MSELEFLLKTGENQSKRMVQDCMDGMALLLHNTLVQVNGKQYPVVVVGPSKGGLMVDIRNLPGFDHIELRIEATGWGRNVNETSDEAEK